MYIRIYNLLTKKESEMSSIIIPSSDADKKRIREAMQEISNSYIRMESERAFVKEAIEALEDDVEIPKKILRKMSKAFHKQNISEIVTAIEDIEALMEATK
jgi:DNA-binding NarL/FixJ family response regulator